MLISSGQSVAKQKGEALREKLQSWMSILSSQGLCVVFRDSGDWVVNETADHYLAEHFKAEEEELPAFLNELSDESPVEELWVWSDKRDGEGPFDLQLLTRKQSEVFELLRRGYSNLEIANAQNTQVRTVEKHVEHIFRKLNIHRREDVTGR